MPSPEVDITPNVARAIQYTGSNSADIDAQVPGLSITSEVGGVLSFTVNSVNFTANTNDWVAWNVTQAYSLNPTQYATEWGCFTNCSVFSTQSTTVDGLESDVGDLQADVTALQGAMAGAFVRSVGVAPVPLLLASGTATVAVQLQPAMPDSGYSAYASKFAGVSLTDLQINSVTVVDTDTVNVAVENVGLVTLTGATVMVHAID